MVSRIDAAWVGSSGRRRGLPSFRSDGLVWRFLRRCPVCRRRSCLFEGKGNCKTLRREAKYNSLDITVEVDIWQKANGQTILFSCKLLPNPGYRELFVRRSEGTFEPQSPDVPDNITISYYGIDIANIRSVMSDSNHCTQDLLFFCADSIPDLTGDYGLFSMGERLSTSDYELREMEEDETDEVCGNKRYNATCQRCGSSPKKLVIHNKEKLPLTNIVLPPGNIATVAVIDTRCA